MKHISKTYATIFQIKIVLFTLVTTFFIASCSKDVYEENSSTIKESFVLKKVSLHDLALQNNEKLMKNVNFIKSLKNNTESSRLIYNPELDFYLDEKNGKYAESSDGHSYTFPIFKSTDSDKVKNLVFVSQPNGEYKTLLFDYNLTKEQMDNLTNAQIANLPYEVFTVDETTTAATFGRQDACFQSFVWAYVPVPVREGDLIGGAPKYEWKWIIGFDGCSGGGRSDDASNSDSSGSDSDAPTGNTGTSGSSNPTGGGSGTGNTVITSPNSGLTPKQYRFLAQLNPLSAGDTFGQLDETAQNHVLSYIESLSSNLASNTAAHFFNTTNMLWLTSQPAATQVSIVDYLIQNGFSNESVIFVENYKKIVVMLNSNENILLDVPCNQLPYWQTIAQFQVPNSVKQKIQNIDNQTGWFTSANIQNLDHPTNGAVVNMDFFPVTITQMPKKPNGVAYTPKELFDYIRLNINDFFESLTFTPVVNTNYGINDTALWQSNNPLGAILTINIYPDEGSVVCSNYNSTTGEWYFTTIETPWDFTHPVSGHRAFGYYTDTSGNMVIYTRGVDRFSFGTHMLGNAGATLEMTNQTIAFSNADATWQNFQQKIKNFVNYGRPAGMNGTSAVNSPEKYRPNWNQVKNVLNGSQPISTLGCN